jgi:hypothetical protein
MYTARSARPARPARPTDLRRVDSILRFDPKSLAAGAAGLVNTKIKKEKKHAMK